MTAQAAPATPRAAKPKRQPAPPPADWLERLSADRDVPLTRQVYGLLRRAIVEGRVRSNVALHEPAIADHLGMSRTPVREALLRLQREGLVEIRPQSGTFVAPIDPERVEEGMIIREALEPRALEIAAAHVDRRTLAALTAETDRMAEAARQDDAAGFIIADDRFHRLLVDASDYVHIAEIIDQVNAHLDRVRMLSVAAANRPEESVREHHALVARLAAGDGTGAAEALRDHLQTSWRVIRAILETLD